jgi:hypothetical protein
MWLFETMVYIAVVVVVGVEVAVPSGPFVILLNFRSKRYWIMLSLSRFRFVVACFPSALYIRSVRCVLFCVAFKMSGQFSARVPRTSSVHIVRCLVPRQLPSVSSNVKSFSNESDVRIMCPKYFN